MNRLVRSGVRGVVAIVAFLVAAVVLLAGVALFALRAGPADWSQRVGLGPLSMALSVPALARVATHPIGARLLAGHSLRTRHGRIDILAGATPGALVLRCAPCLVEAASIAAKPIRLASVEVVVGHGEPNQLLGTVRVAAVQARWQLKLAARNAELEVDIADAPLADLVAAFGDAIPEAARAQIGGSGGAHVRIALPSGRYALQPRLEGLVVSGLGTEALAGAMPTPACGRSPRARTASAPYGSWLAKAVVAAEDQRFFEHPGYDVAEMAAAWSTEGPQDLRRRGASTLSQQLAKLLYTGEERSLARKVRELLYAVELDRGLGKARVLQLYLAVAPWGDGQCGGEAAALHYFGKHAAALRPAEAVWLAGLLHNPELELARQGRGDANGNVRLAGIGDALRPLSGDRRQALHAALMNMTPPLPVLARAEVGALAAR